MKQAIIDEFFKKTGLRLRDLDRDKALKVWRSKGEVYRHALMKVREGDPWAVAPAMIYGSFPAAVLGYFRGHVDEFKTMYEEGSDEAEECRRDFDLRPDLFALDPSRLEIRLHEIEDTHPIEPIKLRKIMKAYGWCDQEYIRLRLFVYDRYGLNRREIDLAFIVFSDFGDDMFEWSLPGVKKRAHRQLGVL